MAIKRSDIDELMQQIPTAIKPVYLLDHPNENITLYKGQVLLCKQAQEIPLNAELIFEWLPSPKIICSGIEEDREKIPLLRKFLDQNSDIRLRIPKAVKEIEVSPYGYSETLGQRITFKLFCETSIETSEVDNLNYLLFHVVNFSRALGKTVKNGYHTWKGRADVIFGEWKLTIDEVEKLNERVDVAKPQRGYIITHIAKLERADGGIFNSRQAKKVLSALYWYLAFCRGAWAPPILPLGFDSNGNQVWFEWQAYHASPWENASGWLCDRNYVSESLTKSLSGFWKLWNNPIWNNEKDDVSPSPLIIAIHWFISANNDSGGIEGSLILAQTGMELMSWTILCQDKKVLSEIKFEKCNTQQKIQKLLDHIGIVDDFPQKFNVLKEMANDNKAYNKQHSLTGRDRKWENVVEAITFNRNMWVHPKKEEPTLKYPYSWQVLQLALRYLELSLLYSFDYDGYYVDRTTAEWAGEVKRIPWISLEGSEASVSLKK
jgi:hypothetical protein